jgi:hypothetical protein
LVDLDRLREIADASDIRLASEREFDRLYPDCETGAMPPLGPLYGQRVFVDRALAGGQGEVRGFRAGCAADDRRFRADASAAARALMTWQGPKRFRKSTSFEIGAAHKVDAEHAFASDASRPVGQVTARNG